MRPRRSRDDAGRRPPVILRGRPPVHTVCAASDAGCRYRSTVLSLPRLRAAAPGSRPLPRRAQPPACPAPWAPGRAHYQGARHPGVPARRAARRSLQQSAPFGGCPPVTSHPVPRASRSGLAAATAWGLSLRWTSARSSRRGGSSALLTVITPANACMRVCGVRRACTGDSATEEMDRGCTLTKRLGRWGEPCALPKDSRRLVGASKSFGEVPIAPRRRGLGTRTCACSYKAR